MAARADRLRLLSLEKIKVGRRCRKDARDIDSLAASIAEIGLLQPLGVWPDHTLACGWRRLLAVKRLGWETVPVHVLSGPDDLLARLKAERDENVCRCEFLPLELDAMGRLIEKAERKAARERKAQAKGQPRGKKAAPVSSANLAEETGDSRDRVAEALGVGHTTYEKIKAVAKAARKEPEKYGDLAEEMNVPGGKVDRAFRKLKQRQKAQAPPVEPPATLALTGDRWRVERADCLAWLAAQPTDSIDLVFGSPPYEDARLYLENGRDEGIALGTEEWVAWMVKVYLAAVRPCKGLVAFVVAGRTEHYRWSAAPALLMADLHRQGIVLRSPPLYHRVGIPGSGGPDWLRGDYEFVVCATRPGPLPWSNNVAMGTPPKYGPGGDPSHRRPDGSRVNRNGEDDGYANPDERSNEGPHRVRQRAGDKYQPPELANPGNVIRCVAGGGNMGDKLCHENEAPFPESLAEFFVRSFCPPGGVVADCFCGSGTTGKVALVTGRHFLGCDVRASQVELTKRRLAHVQLPLFQEA
jgi:ParB-like chromosome segregation protein Spo0J